MFKCDPRRRDFQAFLDRAEDVTSWCVPDNVRGRAVTVGDPALLWVSGSTGATPIPGLWAVGSVVGRDHDPVAGPQIDLRLELLDDPIPRAALAGVVGLERLEVLRLPVGANPSWVTGAEWPVLQALLSQS